MSQKSSTPFFSIEGRKIGFGYPTYFIADIAANHNGSLKKAMRLIELAKKNGADAAKFQHFRADKIVSRYGFDSMSKKISHQAKWGKSVYQVYQEASVPWKWTPELARHCHQVGIHFFSAPYDLEAIDMLDNHMFAYKVGSGDLNWLESVLRMASKGKPVFLATGASTMEEVRRAVKAIARVNPKICVMQCNTNYTGSPKNFAHINLNVLKVYAQEFPRAVLGLSDHTSGHATVLGAVTLGARAVEKHFTDNRTQVGPDHAFSMSPGDWKEMVERVRELELALGTGKKKVEANENETVLIQRRCLRAARDLDKGEILREEDIDVLRPALPGAFVPDDRPRLLNKRIRRAMVKGEAFKPGHIQRGVF